jgi:hypothetical protein
VNRYWISAHILVPASSPQEAQAHKQALQKMLTDPMVQFALANAGIPHERIDVTDPMPLPQSQAAGTGRR